MKRKALLLVLLVALVAAACTSNSSFGVSEQTLESTDDVESPEPGEAEDSESEPIEATPVSVLGTALARTATAERFIVTSTTAQTLQAIPLGIDTSANLDPNRPTIRSQVTPDGSHTVMDLTALFLPLGLDAEIMIEMWQTDDQIVLDTSDYARILELNPGADLGVFRPGIAFIEIARLGATDEELAAAITGSGTVNLGELSQSLPEALLDLERFDGPPVSFRGTMSQAQLVNVLGGDAEANARAAAGGIAQSIQVDPVALGDFYLSFYETTRAFVTVELDPEGRVDQISSTVDLSTIWSQIFDPTNPLGVPVSAAELEEVQAQYDGAVWIVETLTTFEPVDDLELPVAPETTDDRTDEWRAFLIDSGLLDG